MNNRHRSSRANELRRNELREYSPRAHQNPRADKRPPWPHIVSQTVAILLMLCLSTQLPAQELSLTWESNILSVHGSHLPGGQIDIWYLEAYCRADSHTTDWSRHTVIGHRTVKKNASEDGTRIELSCRLKDGVVVDHVITAGRDEVSFRLTAHNPTDQRSEAHWAQPCVRVGKFTGLGADDTDDAYAYLRKSFVFLEGQLCRLPTRDWATEARYTPGQVWAGPGVPRNDVNPRPLHPKVPSNGLIGCFSKDEKLVMAVAFQPYQELFQGVIRCLHSDFRLGGLKPDESKQIVGKLYIMENDVPALLRRYATDFPGGKK